MRRFRLLVFVGLGLECGMHAQTATTLVVPPAPLLGAEVGGVARQGDAVTGEDGKTVDPDHAAALQEDGLDRWAKAKYAGANVEVLQFRDASGARAAFSLYEKSGATRMKPDSADGVEAFGFPDGSGVTLVRGSVIITGKGVPGKVVLGLVSALPQISGPRSQRPLLPRMLPAKGMVAASARYALGPAGYAAAGGKLDAATLGWEKNAEAATADYADKRGRETLTLLLYPTPQIAGQHTRDLQSALGDAAKVRREGELVAVAQGTFAADDAQNLVENIHLRSEVTFDKNITPTFPTELKKTYSLLTSIAVLSGVGMLAAVLLGLFLGVGRASLRKMRGKDAAADVEFLSLHLDPQNAAPKYDATGPSHSADGR